MSRETCRCSAYRFPHRLWGGKCDGVTLVCEQCGEPAAGVEINYGREPYEFWGQRGYVNNIQMVSECCEADLIDQGEA